MKAATHRHLLALPLAACALACGGKDDSTPGDQTPTGPAQCDPASAGYVAFDPANHRSQDLRLQAHVDMLARMDEAKAAPGEAAAKFAEVERLYQETASLRSKVQGRTDDHFDGKPNIGQELDAAIMAGIAAGKTATTAHQVNLAKQKVDKTMVRFFFLSIYHEMVEGTKKNWDEAYGYFGAPADNAENRLGLAKVATKRDTENGTHLEAEIFDGLARGSCELAKALAAAGAEKLDPKTVPALDAIVKETDRKMQRVLAFSAAHEAEEMAELKDKLATDPSAAAAMDVKLAELDPYFRAIEALLIARGGESARRASEIRAAIDAALADRTGAWRQTIDAAGIAARLGAELEGAFAQ